MSPEQTHPVILFDGVCNFCNGTVNFVIRRDRDDRFRFAPLQSAAGQRLLEQYHLPLTQFNSFFLIEDGRVYQKSTAALRVLNGLPWYWQPLQIGRLLPRPLRDGLYDFIARRRYRWFGQKDSCMVPTAEVRKKFL